MSAQINNPKMRKLPERLLDGREDLMMMRISHMQFGGDKKFITALNEAALHRLHGGAANAFLSAVHRRRVKVAVPGADGIDKQRHHLLRRKPWICSGPKPYHRHLLP